jgi:hypothetical protein
VLRGASVGWPTEDTVLRGLAAVGSVALAALWLSGLPLPSAAAAFLAAGVVAALAPWLPLRIAVLGIGGVGGLTWLLRDALALAGLPTLSATALAAIAAGGALAARLVEPGQRIGRNALALAAALVLVTALVPLGVSLPDELDASSIVIVAAIRNSSSATVAAGVFLVLVAFFPLAAILAWPGPDAGLRRRLPRALWAGVFLAATWPLILAVSSHGSARLAAGTAWLVFALWSEAAIAATFIALGGSGAPPGIVYLDHDGG